MPIRRRKDQEATYHATRARLQSLGTAILPPPITIAPHRHHASEIDYTPDVDGLLSAEEVQAALEEHDLEKLARSGVQPMLGDLNMDGNDVQMVQGSVFAVNELGMVLTPAGSTFEGRVHWTDVAGEKRLGVDVAHGAGLVTLLIGNTYVRVRNETGLALSRGKVLTSFGASSANQTINVKAASGYSSGVDSNADVIGVLVADLPSSSEGWAIKDGLLTNGPNLSAWTAGTALYLADNGNVSNNPITEVTNETCSTHVKVGWVISQTNPGVMHVKIERVSNLGDAWNVALDSPSNWRHYLKFVASTESGCGNWQNSPLAYFPHTDSWATPILNNKTSVVILADASGGTQNLTLPSLSTSPTDQTDGRFFFFRKVDQTANEVRISPNTGDTIEGLSQYVLSRYAETVWLFGVGNASDWRILAQVGRHHARFSARAAMRVY